MTEQFDMANLKSTDCPSGVPPCEAEAEDVGNSTSEIQGTPRLALDISAINPPG